MKKRSKKERLKSLISKAALHRSATHLYQSDSRTAKRSRKGRKRLDAPMGASGAMNRRYRQLNQLVHKLHYLIQDEEKAGR